MKKLFVLILFAVSLLSNQVLAENLKKQKIINSKLYENMSSQKWDKSKILNQIYQTESGEYKVYTSELIDIYIISSALYFDFESWDILPDTENHNYFKDVKDYFSPYKNDHFIKSLQNYVDANNKSVNSTVVYSLLTYSFSQKNYDMDITMMENDIFKSAEEFNNFLNSLYNFYIKTNASEFFKNYKPYKEMIIYIQNNLKNIPMEIYIKEMENYTGNKDIYYKNQNIKYCSVMTVFRPFNASFYSINMGNDTYFAGQQSASDFSKNPEKFDINQTISTTIHEFLHNYINLPVYNQNKLIEKLTYNERKEDYANSMYQYMPWHRIVDENIVRAAETAIYAKIYNDKEKAFNEILKKEIEFGGFKNVERVYKALDEYQNNREQYKSIDDYIPYLISVLFSVDYN